jgi:hypothetical protein
MKYINFTAIDQYDFNWTQLDANFNNFQMYVVWPIMFGDLELSRYFGYTDVELIADVVDKDNNIAQGWSAQAITSIIEDTTQGQIHDIQFQVQAHDLAVDYSVKLRIKITRKDSWGDVEGYSYAYIPLKVASLNYVEMKAKDPTIKASPVSISEFKLEVTNKGYYPDVFRFDIRGENGVTGLVETQGLYLSPGQTEIVTLQVMTPEKFFDPGTSNILDIYTWSRLNQTLVNIGSVSVITEGIYISPLIIFSVAIILLVVIVVFLLYKKYNKYIEKRKIKKKPKDLKTKKEKLFSNLFKERKEVKKDKNKDKIEEKKPVEKPKTVEDEEEIVEFIETPSLSKREMERKQNQKEKRRFLRIIKRQEEKQRRKVRK